MFWYLICYVQPPLDLLTVSQEQELHKPNCRTEYRSFVLLVIIHHMHLPVCAIDEITLMKLLRSTSKKSSHGQALEHQES